MTLCRFVLPSKFISDILHTLHYSLLDYSGVRLYYLPPYSPDYNPIEESFSFVKSVLLRNGAEFRAAVDAKDMDMAHFLLHNILAMITPEKAQQWMGHSGYLCTESD